MTRRELRKPCPDGGKRCYRDEESARWAGGRLLARVAEQAEARHRLRPEVWVYRCPNCRWWHLTHVTQRNTRMQVHLEES